MVRTWSSCAPMSAAAAASPTTFNCTSRPGCVQAGIEPGHRVLLAADAHRGVLLVMPIGVVDELLEQRPRRLGSSAMTRPAPAEVSAAMVLLRRLDIAPEDLVDVAANSVRAAPTFAEYIPKVIAARPAGGTRANYVSYGTSSSPARTGATDPSTS